MRPEYKWIFTCSSARGENTEAGRFTGMEHQTVRVPAECLSQAFRKTQKTVTKELTSIVGEIGALGSTDDAAAVLERLVRLREVAASADADERRWVTTLEARLDHVARAFAADAAPSSSGSAEVGRVRLERAIAEHMLRRGRFASARALSEEAGLAELVDAEVYDRAARIEEALRSHDCGPALAWCADNASKLRRLESGLEFELRTREFLELVRANRKLEAIAYARDHLSATAARHAAEMQQAMATLAFDEPARCGVPEYAALFDEARWTELGLEFRRELRQVYGFAEHSSLETALHAGLAALKTAACYDDDARALNCPVCSAPGRALAAGLPRAHHGQSSLICRVTGGMMDENNPPLALPNGHVYSLKALHDMAAANDGVITCPQTGERFALEQLRSVYII